MPTDSERLDFLDRCNRQMNERYGTEYGWRFDWNHNRVCMLSDSNIPAISVRDALDRAMENA